jgi:hypothetical protein
MTEVLSDRLRVAVPAFLRSHGLSIQQIGLILGDVALDSYPVSLRVWQLHLARLEQRAKARSLSERASQPIHE